MKKRIFFLFLIAYCLLFIVPAVQAEYVLPYPSFMPGNKMYRVSRIVDKLKEYWYFGNIAKSKYHLALSDKYLVEAKILFEYKQYLLAVDALQRSDDHFKKLPLYIKNDLQKQTIREASDVHVRVLDELSQILPDEFQWRPERDAPTLLPIHTLLIEARSYRRAVKDICL